MKSEVKKVFPFGSQYTGIIAAAIAAVAHALVDSAFLPGIEPSRTRLSGLLQTGLSSERDEWIQSSVAENLLQSIFPT